MPPQGASFPLQLALSTLVVGGVVAGLVLLGQSNASPALGSGLAPAAASSLARPNAMLPPGPPASPSAGARRLLPASAWLVADFEGKLMGPAPFAGQLAGPCESLPAPERVGIAVLPGGGASAADNPAAADGEPLGGLALVLAVPRVSAAFWDCAKQKVLLSGGEVEGKARGFEVLKSPSGLLIRTPDPHLLFVTDDSLLEMALAVARHAAPSAAEHPRHEEQVEAIAGRQTPVAPAAGAALPSLLLTLDLPPQWLAAAGPEANESPLRFLTGAALLARADGSAKAALTCREPGCKELVDFLHRAKDDLAAELPPGSRAELASSLTAQLLLTSPDSGRLVLSWASPRVPLPELAKQIYQQLTQSPGSPDR